MTTRAVRDRVTHAGTANESTDPVHARRRRNTNERKPDRFRDRAMKCAVQEF